MEKSLRQYFTFLILFFLFIILETAIVSFFLYNEFFILIMMINYLCCGLIAPFIIEKFKEGKIDPFSPLSIFSLGYLLLFGVRTLDLIIFNPNLIRNDQSYYNLVILYSIIALHFFQTGYFLIRIKPNKYKKIVLSSNYFSSTKFKLLLTAYASLSVISLLLIIKISGGFIKYFGNIGSSILEITTGSGFLFTTVLLIQIPLIIYLCLILKKYKKISISFMNLLFITILLFFLLGERGHLIALIISLLVCFHYLKKRITFIKMLGYSFIIIFFLTIYGQYRNFTTQGYKFKKAGFKLDLGAILLYKHFINNFDQLIRAKDIIRNIPENLDYQYGKTFLNLIFKPIPSRIWDGKPQGAGYIITKNIYPKHLAAKATIAPSLLGELYLNFHIVGVIIGFFIFGVICKYLYIYLLENKYNISAVAIYSITLPYVYSELRGDFAVVTSFYLFNLIFVVIALKYVSIRGQVHRLL